MAKIPKWLGESGDVVGSDKINRDILVNMWIANCLWFAHYLGIDCGICENQLTEYDIHTAVTYSGTNMIAHKKCYEENKNVQKT